MLFHAMLVVFKSGDSSEIVMHYHFQNLNIIDPLEHL